MYHFLPKFLSELCYELQDYELGLAASERFINNNKPDANSYDIQLSWYNIYKLLVNIPKDIPKHIVNS